MTSPVAIHMATRPANQTIIQIVSSWKTSQVLANRAKQRREGLTGSQEPASRHSMHDDRPHDDVDVQMAGAAKIVPVRRILN